MDIRHTSALAFVAVAGFFLASTSSAQAPAPPPGKPAAAAQIDPNGDLAKLYPQAGSIGLALAIVPDPNIPRYRRLFDLQVQAITLGMLNDGYVLDRYAFPWSGTTNEKDPKLAPGFDPDPSAFGLLIFRCDGWRGHLCQDPSTVSPGSGARPGGTTRVRAIYLVTDTATWGVSPRPLTCATRRIREQLSPAPTQELAEACRRPSGIKKPETSSAVKVELLRFPGRCDVKGGGKQLVVLGPNFSGAMDSVGQQAASLVDSEINALCLVSSSTTESSNPNAENQYRQINYVRLAVDDGIKLLRLSELAETFGYFKPVEETSVEQTAADKEALKKAEEKRRRNRNYKVAFLAEASTFGYGVCNPWTQMNAADLERIRKFCRDSQTLYFPAAVADIRHGIDQQRESQKTDVEAAVKAALANDHLSLDVGSDNGSELPESRQSRLTAVSQQLALDHVLEQVEQYRPKMVIVVATDVRDRLFLFDQLRGRLPSAMLIDLESDILLAHPDFLHASRGAVTVASANLFVRWGRLFGCEQNGGGGGNRRVPLASWALDAQGILASAVGRLYDSGQPAPAQPCVLDNNVEKFGARSPVLHVVTLNGLRRISRVVDLKPEPGSRAEDLAKAREARPRNVEIGQWLSVLCCFAVVLPWLWIRPLRKANKPVLTLAPWEITLCAGVAGAVIWAFAMLAAYSGEDPESGFALVYWSLGILSIGVGGLHQCLRRVEEAGQTIKDLPRRHRCAIAAAGLLACLLAAAPPVANYLLPDPDPKSVPPVVDDELLMRLALDIGQGLAYHVVVALGVITVLAVMIALATGLCILIRNNRLLDIKTESPGHKRSARSPHFPASAILGVVFFIALIAGPSLIGPLGGPRLTIFGPWASLIATVVLVVCTLGTTIFTVIAIHSSRRIRTISAHIGRCVAPPLSPGRTEPSGEYPGLWPASEWQPDLFAATPVVARVGADVIAGLNKDKGRTWKALVDEFLGKSEGERVDDGEHRRAVFALLASEVSLYRWFVIGAVLCAVAAVCAAYLFPLEADALLMWNLMVLVVHAFLAGYVATSFERDGVLSNILCNRPKKAAFSATLFTYAALPFFALGFAIAVSQVPGVVDWGGGLLALLNAIGIGP